MLKWNYISCLFRGRDSQVTAPIRRRMKDLPQEYSNSEHDLGEDDIYDCVPCDDDGDDIYEDIIKVEVRQPMIRYMQKMGMTEEDKRNCCLVEIQETEAKYYKTLEDVEKNYMIPLKQVFTPQEMEAIFVNLEDVIKVHSALLRAIDLNMLSGGSGLGKIFLEFKERKDISVLRRLENSGNRVSRGLLVNRAFSQMDLHLAQLLSSVWIICIPEGSSDLPSCCCE
ncbi:hypothetical protein NQZ68_014479 [Dissostichus eleginoides]|nr:hypothetical protein NQZ68_014479 [Dissostichus eleginoides]